MGRHGIIAADPPLPPGVRLEGQQLGWEWAYLPTDCLAGHTRPHKPAYPRPLAYAGDARAGRRYSR